MSKKRKKYTEEFKQEAVQLMENRGERSVAEIADDIGISAKQLYNWRPRHGAVTTVRRSGEGETLAEENRRLRRENQILKTERAILKKAAAFFAKESQ